MLGIEITRKGSTVDLYKHVDRVLSGQTKGEVSISVKRSTVAHSLQKMMKPNSHFSVCTIRDCESITGTPISGERMKIYQAIHCVNWNDMDPDFRQQIVAMVLDDFRELLNT
jgi:hypothetical protein